MLAAGAPFTSEQGGGNGLGAGEPGELVGHDGADQTRPLVVRAGLDGGQPRQRLDQGIERKLTLISAPARSGKTTLLSEWMAAAQASERPAAWISLDQSDNDPTLF